MRFLPGVLWIALCFVESRAALFNIGGGFNKRTYKIVVWDIVGVRYLDECVLGSHDNLNRVIFERGTHRLIKSDVNGCL